MATLLLLTYAAIAQHTYKYSVATTAWEAGLGNHRAIIQVPATSSAAYLNLEWRRHDKDVDKRRFVIINAASKDTVSNIFRITVNNERCELVFGPVNAGKYYIYYLPSKPQAQEGYYVNDYLPPEPEADKAWVRKNAIGHKSSASYTKVVCTEIQSRTAFDSFYPMEVTANEAEKKKLRSLGNRNFLLFAEDRKHPIRMLDNIPQRWASRTPKEGFTGKASRNEYYTFQVGLWALLSVEDVSVEFSPLKGKAYTLPARALTCFNTGGTDASGKPFTKVLRVPGTMVQPLWIGVNLPADIPAGTYIGKLTVITKNAGSKELPIEISVNSQTLADRGDSETWRHSRLRWLNSTAGIDEQPVLPYQPIQALNNGGIELTGKEVLFASNGLPSSIRVYGEEVLAAPVTFSILTQAGEVRFANTNADRPKIVAGVMTKSVQQRASALNLTTQTVIEADGWMKYSFEIEALIDLDLADVRLEIPYRKEISTYMMGMGLPGTETPGTRDSKWDGPYTSFLAKENPNGLRFDNGADLNYGPYDSFWLGSPKAGLHCELRGAPYTGSLLREFKPGPPPNWHNGGKGGFSIRTIEKQQDAIAYSGERKLKKGERLSFECTFIITPVKKLDTRLQFTERYFQSTPDPNPGEKDLAKGIRVINVHHANTYNPYINYPFLAVKEMKGFVNKWHDKGMKVKIYNSVTGVSNYATEIWALRSLGTEILKEGKGGGAPWLREHLLENYTTFWYQPLANGDIDASVYLSAQSSRWYNYYIEGLKWLVKNVGIDGIYLDDVAYGRDMIKRIRKVVSQDRPDFLMDLHSHRWYSGGPALQYAEFYPYINKLWFGEEFHYNEMPAANWMVETSGIPFGVMGDMLQDGGNPWRGMLYGMSSRLGWTGDPSAIWGLWDNFGIADSKMVGYWDDQPVVTTNNSDVLATAYLNNNKKVLISVASWAKQTVSVSLNIDFKRLGLDPGKVIITAPELKNIQPGRQFKPGEPIAVDPMKGWLFLIDEL